MSSLDTSAKGLIEVITILSDGSISESDRFLLNSSLWDHPEMITTVIEGLEAKGFKL